MLILRVELRLREVAGILEVSDASGYPYAGHWKSAGHVRRFEQSQHRTVADLAQMRPKNKPQKVGQQSSRATS